MHLVEKGVTGGWYSALGPPKSSRVEGTQLLKADPFQITTASITRSLIPITGLHVRMGSEVLRLEAV